MPAVWQEILGREPELKVVQGFLDDTVAGPGALVLEGEAGIGKTTLWRAAVDLARQRGDRVLTCRPAEPEAKLQLAALADLLEEVVDEVLPDLPQPPAQALEAALLRADAQSPGPEPRAVPLAFLGILRGLSTHTPLTLGIDDLQWLDVASGRALAFALRRLGDEPVRLVVTVRSTDSRGCILDLNRLLSPRRCQRIEVDGLEPVAIERVLLARLGRVVPRPVARRVHEASGGNPLFALEIMRELDRLGASAARSVRLPLPGSLRELVSARIAALPPQTRQALLAASALSHPKVSVVQAATGSAAGFTPAVDAGVIEISGDRLEFTHPLLASAAYGGAAPERRRRLHAALAASLDDLVEQARHLALASVEPDAEVAATLEAAALEARTRGTPADAAALCEQSMRLTPPADQAELRRRAALGAEFHFDAGDTSRALSLFERVAGESPDGPERARALTRRGAMYFFQGHLARSEEVLAEAERNADAAPAILAAAEEARAWTAHLRGDSKSALSRARASLALAEEAGDRATVVATLSASAHFGGRCGRRGALQLVERAQELASAVEGEAVRNQPGWIHAALVAGRGDLDGARARLMPLYERAMERGDEGSISIILSFLNRVELRAGNWTLAARYAEEGYQAAAEAGQVSQQIFLLGDRALIEAHRGQVEEARETVALGRKLTERTGFDRLLAGIEAAEGFLELSHGEIEASDRVLRPLVERVSPSEITEQGSFRFLADEVEALLGRGEVELAAEVVDRLERRRRVAHDSAWVACVADRCRGLVLASGGLPDAGLEELARALRRHRRLPEPFEEARTRLGLGRLLRRLKRKAPAREQLRGARETFDRLGAPLWSELAGAELARIGGRAPREGGLTPTPNREVAAELFLSVNTVQANLKRIYRELDVRSRTELSRLLTESSKNTDSGDFSAPPNP